MRYIVFIVLLLNVLNSFSQERPNFQNFEGDISGKILDEQSKKPMPYANISVFRMKDSTLAGGGITEKRIF